MHTQYLLDFPWKRIVQAWPQLSCATAQPLSGGLINKTVRMSTRDGCDYVLQWLNPVFPPSVNSDVAAVARHLSDRGIPAFSVIPTQDGQDFLLHDVGSFRLLTYLEGDFLTTGEIAAAGAALASFHRALFDCSHAFSHDRNIHQPHRHAAHLREALATHAGHRLHPEVLALAGQLLDRLDRAASWDAMPKRIVHGDPKLENFWRTPQGVALLDLDTVGRHTILGELGDAARSMCRENNAFSPALFNSFFQAYFENAPRLTQEEIRQIPQSMEIIACELAARFLADALEERYFGWDPASFATRGDHNLERARQELAFAKSAAAAVESCEKFVETWI